MVREGLILGGLRVNRSVIWGFGYTLGTPTNKLPWLGCFIHILYEQMLPDCRGSESQASQTRGFGVANLMDSGISGDRLM